MRPKTGATTPALLEVERLGAEPTVPPRRPGLKVALVFVAGLVVLYLVGLLADVLWGWLPGAASTWPEALTYPQVLVTSLSWRTAVVTLALLLLAALSVITSRQPARRSGRRQPVPAQPQEPASLPRTLTPAPSEPASRTAPVVHDTPEPEPAAPPPVQAVEGVAPPPLAEAMPPPLLPRVFISHSSADNAFGRELARRLRLALGSEDAVFYDADAGLLADAGLVGGDTWLDQLQHEIAERNVFVLLLSPAAFASPWVTKELRLALRQAVSVAGKVLIPVLHQNTEVWPFLADYQIVRFVPTAPIDPPIPYKEAFADLLAAVRLGTSRLLDLQALRTVRLGPPFDLEQLPLPPRFVGRAADINWALRQLTPQTADETPRAAGLASITAVNGLPGIGKSALAGHIVRILYAENRFPEGIAVVLCNGLTDPTVVLRQVLARFDPEGREPEETALRALQDRAKAFFRQRSALVVLDNIEPDWPVEQVIASLRAGGVAVLATSRVRLPDVAVPAEGSRELELLSPEEAQDLFAEYYGRGSTADLTLPEQELVRRITTALGEHTLAIKLAAARARQRDLARVAAEYEADLRAGIHLRDGREAVEVVLESSVASLPARAQQLFAALAVFATADVGREAVLALAQALDDPDPGNSLNAILDLRLADLRVQVEVPEGC